MIVLAGFYIYYIFIKEGTHQSQEEWLFNIVAKMSNEQIPKVKAISSHEKGYQSHCYS